MAGGAAGRALERRRALREAQLQRQRHEDILVGMGFRHHQAKRLLAFHSSIFRTVFPLFLVSVFDVCFGFSIPSLRPQPRWRRPEATSTRRRCCCSRPKHPMGPVRRFHP